MKIQKAVIFYTDLINYHFLYVPKICKNPRHIAGSITVVISTRYKPQCTSRLMHKVQVLCNFSFSALSFYKMIF